VIDGVAQIQKYAASHPK